MSVFLSVVNFLFPECPAFQALVRVVVARCKRGHFYCRLEHEQLKDRLKNVERKVIVGGVDLLKKAEEQEKLLEESNIELQERKQQEAQLRQQIEEKEVLKVVITRQNALDFVCIILVFY